MENSHIFKDEKEIYSIIGKNVRYYRKLYSLTKKEMTQETLAEYANVSTSLIGNLESKKTIQYNFFIIVMFGIANRFIYSFHPIKYN